jgi:hypothetical protein
MSAIHPNLTVFGAGCEVFAVRGETDTPDVEVAGASSLFVEQDTATSVHCTWGPHATYQTLPPDLTSYICAVRLQPVARYLPSFENLTQHTTLNLSA